MEKRQIIFRVWHNGEMYYRWDKKGEIIIRNGGYVILEMPNGMPLFSGELIGLDGAVLMQFVGLKDKNYKMIFEGDVMKTYHGNYEVEFESGQFQLKDFDHYGVNGESPDLEELEIIGNVFENGELINK